MHASNDWPPKIFVVPVPFEGVHIIEQVPEHEPLERDGAIKIDDLPPLQ
jgi:hypothetical protein